MKINEKTIGMGNPCYLIAELSHNHQGEEIKALELITRARDCGFDAVKFQKRNNSTLFMPEFYQAEYTSANSFGKTYGEHRDFLEPKKGWLVECNAHAHRLGLDFIMTVFDQESLVFCEEHLKIDAYKIQSADLTNIPLIQAVAATGKPYFISCGASSLNEIKEAYHCCLEQDTPFVLMYAISSYPTPRENLNLSRIPFLKKALETEVIGYSCHFLTNEASLLARTLGANVIERHFTLDKSQKGPDHKLSATPDEISVLVGELSRIDQSLGLTYHKPEEIESYQLDSRYKMGKCAVAKHNLEVNDVLTESDVIYQSPAKGLTPLQLISYLNKPVKNRVKAGEVLTAACFQEQTTPVNQHSAQSNAPVAQST
jgi:sialic acid synthase